MVDIPERKDFEELKQELQSLKALVLLAVDSCQVSHVLTIADICKLEKVSRTQITTKERYLLPNCGVSDYPDGTARWNIGTYLNWSKLPLSERKAMYTQQLEIQRQRSVKKGVENEIKIKDRILQKKGA